MDVPNIYPLFLVSYVNSLTITRIKKFFFFSVISVFVVVVLTPSEQVVLCMVASDSKVDLNKIVSCLPSIKVSFQFSCFTLIVIIIIIIISQNTIQLRHF